MKRKSIYAISFFFLFGLCAIADVLQIPQFSGLNSDDNPLFLKNGQTSDSLNVVTDSPGGGLESRNGFIQISTTPAKRVFEFSVSDGTKYFICHDSADNTLKASESDNGLFTIFIDTLPSGITTSFAQLGDKLFYSNTANGLSYWDTTSTTTVDANLKFTSMVNHVGRIWGIGNPSAPRTIYASALSDGTDFTLVADPADDDPAQFSIGGVNDGPLTGIKFFRGALMWFTSRSFGSVVGSDRLDFSVVTYSNDVGTSYKDSVQDCGGLLRWIGPNKTVWEFNGASHQKISEDIDTLLSDLAQGDSESLFYQITSEDDFNAGTNTHTSNYISPGDVVLSTYAHTDTSGSDFNQGTNVNTSTSVADGFVYLVLNSSTVVNGGFETGTDSGWTGYAPDSYCESSYIGGVNLLTPRTGSYLQCIGESGDDGPPTSIHGQGFVGEVSLYVDLIDSSPSANLLVRQPISYSDSVWVLNTIIPGSDDAGKIARLKIVSTGPNGTLITYSDYFLLTGQTNPITFYCRSVYWTDADSENRYWAIDDVSGGRSSTSSGTFTSATFDTGLNYPLLDGVSSILYQEKGHRIVVSGQKSTDSVTWATVSWPSTAERYFRYIVSFSTLSTGSGVPYFSELGFKFKQSTGSYVSESIDIDGISTWSSVGIRDSIDGGSITYAIYSDSDSNKTVTNGVPVSGTYISSQTVTNGTIPSFSTSAYAFFSADFSITKATQTPTLSSLTLNWDQGTTIECPSGFINQRYWVGVALASNQNNRILVYDKKRQWQLYSNILANCIGVYRGKYYAGNGTGIYLLDEGTNDDGTPITSYFKTQVFAPSGLDKYSTFRTLRLTADKSDSTLASYYYVNGDNSNVYTLGSFSLSDKAGIQNRTLHFKPTEIQRAKYISFLFSVTSSVFWRLLNGNLDFIPDPIELE